MPVTMSGGVVQKKIASPGMTSNRGATGTTGKGKAAEKPKKMGEEPVAAAFMDTELFIAASKLKISEELDINSNQVKFLQKGTVIAIRRRSEITTIPPMKRAQIAVPNVVKPMGWVTSEKNGTPTLEPYVEPEATPEGEEAPAPATEGATAPAAEDISDPAPPPTTTTQVEPAATVEPPAAAPAP